VPPSPVSTRNPLKIIWPVVLVGGALGFGLSWGVLSGDQQGRVNLFYLLLVYLLIPLLSALISLCSLLFGKGLNLARLVLALPVWSYSSQVRQRNIHQLNLDKHWLLMQSQIAAVAFSIASLLVFFILLLATDLNFVWRSTLLQASDLLPWLELIAKPWAFWPAAQPQLEVLQLTQDSRLLPLTGKGNAYANWWPFVLATQLTYSLLPRILLWVSASWLIRRRFKADTETLRSHRPQQPDRLDDSFSNSTQLVDRLPDNIVINNWAGAPLDLLKSVPQVCIDPDTMLAAGPSASESQLRVAERWQGEQLVVVKSWEPPLGELQDFLECGHGYLLPLDWHGAELVTPKPQHLQEWLRFTNKFDQWQLFQPRYADAR